MFRASHGLFIGQLEFFYRTLHYGPLSPGCEGKNDHAVVHLHPHHILAFAADDLQPAGLPMGLSVMPVVTELRVEPFVEGIYEIRVLGGVPDLRTGFDFLVRHHESLVAHHQSM